ncbi:MAG: biotin synthase [bacterium]|jgi:biotin synthase
MSQAKKTWTKEEISAIYETPVLELIHRAATVHREHHNSQEIQVATLLSIKTGGCSEDCGYCSQSSRYTTGLERESLLDPEFVITKAIEAQKNGSTRFCMGAAWRKIRDNKDFDDVLTMVRQVSALGMEVCCTLGMLTTEQAQKLKEAGLTAYNHNLDTGREYYNKVVTTRTYDDRLETIDNVSKVGISLCSGGIIGLGESSNDRIDLLHTLAGLDTPPESVPINALVPIPGTPLEQQKKIEIWEIIKMIATARIIMPTARVRLSAGREQMSELEQGICFLAGANSIFSGDKLLTAPNAGASQDAALFAVLGVKAKGSRDLKAVKKEEAVS